MFEARHVLPVFCPAGLQTQLDVEQGVLQLSGDELLRFRLSGVGLYDGYSDVGRL
jgi:hypothetical protein